MDVPPRQTHRGESKVERRCLQYHRLIVYQRAVEYDHLSIKLLAIVQRYDRSLADHLRRSGNSLLTSIAEGASADQPKMKAASYRTAKREAEECSSCWEKSVRERWTPEGSTMQLLGKLDEVARMLGQLIIRFDPH
jgi:four helix bundle protein